MSDREEKLSLADAASHLVEECRMVLPGVQAIFGFQLMVVFQQKFGEALEKAYQYLHLAALVLVAIAAAVIMTPAAYHRIRGVTHVSDRFINVSSRLLVIALAPLALGLSIDVFILGKLVLDKPPLAAVMAAAVFGVMVFMWYFFPRVVDGRRGHA